MPHTFQAVLFDMDGVLIDSEATSTVAMQEACHRFGFSVPEADLADFLGLPGDVTYGLVAARYAANRVDAVTLRAVRDSIYEELLPGIPPVPGALEAIARYQRAELFLALVTSSRRAHADSTVARLGLHTVFSAVIGAEDISRPKPDPAPYLAAASALGIEPSRCAVIEDSTNGVRSAVSAGSVAFGLTTSFAAAALTEAGAHRVYADHAPLADAVLGGQLFDKWL